MKTIQKIKVENMLNYNNNAATNQFIIYTQKGVYFISYSTIIAYRDNCTNTISLDKKKWNYSATTGKYRNLFLNENIAATRKKIKSGEYKLINLN